MSIASGCRAGRVLSSTAGLPLTPAVQRIWSSFELHPPGQNTQCCSFQARCTCLHSAQKCDALHVLLALGMNSACTFCSHSDVKQKRVKEMHKFVLCLGLEHLHCFHLNKVLNKGVNQC